MAQTLLATLKILLALFGTAAAAGLLAGFLDGARTGRRAFWLVLVLGSVLAALQIFALRFWPLVFALAGALVALYAALSLQRARQRRQ